MSTSFGFVGEWRDGDTGYTYQRARWVDTSTGSFLSVDPMLQSTSEAYLYAGGDPINRLDPLGLCDNNWLNPASDCYNFVDSGPFKSATNFVVAFGDNISLGGTNMVRDWMGTNNAIDKCDSFYKAGDATGELVSFFIPGGQFKGVIKTASKSLVSTSTKALNDIKRISTNERGAISLPFSNKNYADGKIKVDAEGSVSISDKIKRRTGDGGEGYIYLRMDRNDTTLPYVGKAKSENRYNKRQKEHQRDNSTADFVFTPIGRADGKELGRMEEYYIRQLGFDNLSNKIHGLGDKKYSARGGDY